MKIAREHRQQLEENQHQGKRRKLPRLDPGLGAL